MDKVVLYQNTSVMQDEILAHRVGLVPIKFNPDLLEDKKPEDQFNDENSLRFYLKVKCLRKKEFSGKTSEEIQSLRRE